ncbi:TIGR03557 family F420-dependent LLM class oxidoreductase [Microbacterium esteraromaticum]|uniref:TIGR03557 family F420-dependent LLM class oxidoreductase n=1 Tax=Microbacterium esteraromaticum TaxID=57043 RepID=A0A7D7WH89_9MICO|nr:TIGR03557 family F420-dependent LLM class oxidoreductase [Microbacterium esteraromaticum]QMU98552.1 TIGR03557 family F420-dependent LLM class oxidoreductase [Microbacterium esteraromaticum]
MPVTAGAEITIGFAPMLQQFRPDDAIRHSVEAAESGFGGIVLSDHFQPWLPQQGNASYMWSVMGALGQQVSVPLLGVTTPGYRSHPAVTAQAAATIAVLYPGRFQLGLGSGQSLNEHIVGEYWPPANERVERLFESVELVRKLLGSTRRDVRHDGEHFRLEPARLWTLPDEPPPVVVATSGPVAARRAGRVADGIITVQSPPDRLQLMLDRFETGVAESATSGPKRRMIQLHVSWAHTRDLALEHAREEWAHGGLRFPTADIRSPYDFAMMTKHVEDADLADRMLISSEPEEHREHIQRYVDLGFDHVYVHNVGRNQSEFIQMYATHVLPEIGRRR